MELQQFIVLRLLFPKHYHDLSIRHILCLGMQRHLTYIPSITAETMPFYSCESQHPFPGISPRRVFPQQISTAFYCKDLHPPSTEEKEKPGQDGKDCGLCRSDLKYHMCHEMVEGQRWLSWHSGSPHAPHFIHFPLYLAGQQHMLWTLVTHSTSQQCCIDVEKKNMYIKQMEVKKERGKNLYLSSNSFYPLYRPTSELGSERQECK